MIQYTQTNIFESNADVLVNTVNTVGVMGKGLAKEFKRLYPDMFISYQQYCENNQLTIGKLQIYKTSNKWILNFPTKENWRNSSKIEYIELGLQKFIAQYAAQGIKSISFPMLGCGNGGLDWETEVKPLMIKYLGNLPIDIFIHTAGEDKFAPEHKNQSTIDKWLKSEPYFLSNIEFTSHIDTIYSNLFNTVINKELNLQIDVSKEKIINGNIFYIMSQETKICISEETLHIIWQSLKNCGVLHKDMLSQELAKHSNLIMLFLSQLEYITLTQLTNGDIAVRLLAYNQPKIRHKIENPFAA